MADEEKQVVHPRSPALPSEASLQRREAQARTGDDTGREGSLPASALPDSAAYAGRRAYEEQVKRNGGSWFSASRRK